MFSLDRGGVCPLVRVPRARIHRHICLGVGAEWLCMGEILGAPPDIIVRGKKARNPPKCLVTRENRKRKKQNERCETDKKKRRLKSITLKAPVGPRAVQRPSLVPMQPRCRGRGVRSVTPGVCTLNGASVLRVITEGQGWTYYLYFALRSEHFLFPLLSLQDATREPVSHRQQNDCQRAVIRVHQ